MNKAKNMKKIFLLCLLSSCSTSKFLEYKDGEIVKERQNITRTTLSKEYNMSLKQITDKHPPLLIIAVSQSEQVKEDWEDVYSQFGIYETRSPLDFYEPIVTQKPTSKTVVKKNTKTLNSESSVFDGTIKLTFNKVISTSKIVNGLAEFNLNSLNLKSNNLPNNAEVWVDFKNQHINMSKDYSDLIRDHREQIKKSENEGKAYSDLPGDKYQITYCAQPELLNSIYGPRGTIEPNCIYHIAADALKVLQVTPQGILVTLSHDFDPSASSKIFLIKTSKSYVDDDLVGNMFVKSIGTISYTNVLGGMKTIHAFQDRENK